METLNDARPAQGGDQHDESFGRYRLLQRLGRGGMAEVFKAKSFGVEGFEKVLVIKRILPELVASKRFVDLFVHEAKLAVRLSHANIVQVFDLGKVEDGPLPQYFIAMEYVAGLDLATLLSRGKRRGTSFPVAMSAYIAAEVAKGLDHAHRRRDEQMRPLGIVHRDISPQNVLLSWEGEVKVTDFGIAKARDTFDERPEDEPSGIILQGKYGYMSPEQAMGEAVDARSDIFSLGTLLYEAIAGAHPFSTGSGEETLRRVRAAEYPPLELVRPDVPKGLADIVKKALAKDPGARHADAGRMHEELLAFLYASQMRFGPNELSDLLANFRDPSPGVVVELGGESPEETRPHPKGEAMTKTPAPIAELATTKLGPKKPKAIEPSRAAEAPIRYGKFVGRRAELQRLGEIFALATRRKVQVVTLRGEAGVGKTRLLHEVERRLRRGQLDVAFYVIACSPDGSSHALSGLTAMLRALAGLNEGGGFHADETMEPRLRALGLRDEEVGAVLSQLGANRGEASLARLRSAFARMVAKLSEDQLHVFAWDNADALDAQSIEVLDGALQRMSGARAVFLLSGRGKLAHSLERLSSHHSLGLAGLEDAEIEQLLASRTGLRQAPPELVAFCKERAKDHPLFLEEIVRELVESRTVVVEHGGIVEMRLDAAAGLPTELESLLVSRIERLPEGERHYLEAAAVLGDPARLDLLGAMIDAPPSEIEAMSLLFEERRLVRRKGASSVTFVSPLVRETLLAAVGAEALRELHRRAGLAYEARATDEDEQASRIALHFAEAGQEDRAAGYFARSGMRQALVRQWEGAARDLARALSLCEPSRRQAAELADWIERFAEAAHRARGREDLDAVAGRLVRRIDEEGDLAMRVSARVNLARALGAMHAFDEADAQLDAARELSNEDDALARGALVVEGELAMRRGDFRKSLACFEKASRLAEAAPPAESARILSGLAQSLAAMGERDEALETMNRADELASRADLALLAENAKIRALIHYSTRNFAEAARESEKAIELGRDLGLAYEVAINLHNLGDALLRLGDLPRAYASFQQSSSIFDDLGQERMAAQNRGYLAYLDSLLGVAGAEKTLKESIGYASVHGYAWDEVNGRYLLALLHEKAGDLASAKLELERTRELADAIGFRLVQSDCEAALERLLG